MSKDTNTQALPEFVTRDLQGLVRALYAEADKCEMFNIDTPAKLLREAAAVIQPEANAQTMDMFAEVVSSGHLAEELDNLRMSLHHQADAWEGLTELDADLTAAKLREIAGDHKPHRKLPLLPPDKAERVHAIVNAGHFPGMSEAFDAHMGAACWTDPAYAPDASLWAAAWKAAKARADHIPEAGKMVQPVAAPQGARYLLVPLDDDGKAMPIFCADEAAVSAALLPLMFFLQHGESLSDAHREEFEANLSTLLDEGSLAFEGDPGIHLYRLAGRSASPAVPAPALAPQGLPDPLGCNACTHPACARYDGPRSVECRAMADNACARPTKRAHGIGGKA